MRMVPKNPVVVLALGMGERQLEAVQVQVTVKTELQNERGVLTWLDLVKSALDQRQRPTKCVGNFGPVICPYFSIRLAPNDPPLYHFWLSIQCL